AGVNKRPTGITVVADSLDGATAGKDHIARSTDQAGSLIRERTRSVEDQSAVVNDGSIGKQGPAAGAGPDLQSAVVDGGATCIAAIVRETGRAGAILREGAGAADGAIDGHRAAAIDVKSSVVDDIAAAKGPASPARADLQHTRGNGGPAAKPIGAAHNP